MVDVAVADVVALWPLVVVQVHALLDVVVPLLAPVLDVPNENYIYVQILNHIGNNTLIVLIYIVLSFL